MITSTEHSALAETLGSTELPLSPAQTVAQPSSHECGWPRVVEPPTTVRAWQDVQPEKMLDRYKVAPIGLPD